MRKFNANFPWSKNKIFKLLQNNNHKWIKIFVSINEFQFMYIYVYVSAGVCIAN